MKRALAAIAAAIGVGGCSLIAPTPFPEQSLPTPEAPASSNLAALGGAMLIVATSGTFIEQSKRDIASPAHLVVWDDGLMTANVASLFEPPEYRAIPLTSSEVEGLRQRLIADHLETYVGQDVTGNSIVCADCNVEIFETDVSGVTVEIAIGGLGGIVGRLPGQFNELPYPANVNALAKEVALLSGRFEHGGGDRWAGKMPIVMVARPQAGG